MQQIGVLGCGWLGVPLGIHLKNKGGVIRGSRTTDAGAAELNKTGIQGFKVHLRLESTHGIDAFLNKLDTLIISIPPRRKIPDGAYAKKMERLINALEDTALKRIIFLSSTSVYGPASNTYTEESLVFPETAAAKSLFESEQYIAKTKIPSVIVRLGGFIGPDRNPVFQLQDKIISNPKGRINFVHQVDAVNAIGELIENAELNGVFNLVCPHHPLREDYYLHWSKKLQLPTPRFAHEEVNVRIVQGNKITEKTSFNYTVNNLLI